MNNDSKLIFESYVDGITKRKSQLSNYIYDLVKYGIPSKEEFIKIRQQLHDEVARIEKRGTPPTPEEKEFGRELIKKIQLYRKDNPDDPPVLYPDRDKKQEQEEERDSFDVHVDQLKNTPTEELIEDLKDLYRIVSDEENVGDYSYDSAKLDIEIIHDILKSRGLNFQKDIAPIWNKIDDEVNGNEENAEDMSKSPFHYDPMHGLASAANKIRDELRSAANDEARPEHIERMAEIILGPQSQYASVDHYEKALSGVIELLNHYVMVEMN